MRKTCIESWNKEWIEIYQSEKNLLMSILKDEIVAIHHIGSTSLVEIGYAKPIIDILVEVNEINRIDTYHTIFKDSGYIVRGENGIPFRRYFIKGVNPRIAHIHIHQVGDRRITTHLNFKKYIQLHPELGKEYGLLKLRLAKEFPNDSRKYQEAKNPFLNQLIEQIHIWEKQQ